jgi:hypothetical protein
MLCEDRLSPASLEAVRLVEANEETLFQMSLHFNMKKNKKMSQKAWCAAKIDSCSRPLKPYV